MAVNEVMNTIAEKQSPTLVDVDFLQEVFDALLVDESRLAQIAQQPLASSRLAQRRQRELLPPEAAHCRRDVTVRASIVQLHALAVENSLPLAILLLPVTTVQDDLTDLLATAAAAAAGAAVADVTAVRW